MLSSTAPRASQSAELIAHELGITFGTDRVLWSKSWCDVKMSRVGQLIERCEADNLILVTHYEYTKELPEWFGRSIGASFDRQAIEKCEAYVIDCDDKTISRIR